MYRPTPGKHIKSNFVLPIQLGKGDAGYILYRQLTTQDIFKIYQNLTNHETRPGEISQIKILNQTYKTASHNA